MNAKPVDVCTHKHNGKHMNNNTAAAYLYDLLALELITKPHTRLFVYKNRWFLFSDVMLHVIK